MEPEQVIAKMAEENQKLSGEVTRLIQALGGLAPPNPDANALRAKNFLQMRKDFRKSQRVKNFTEKQDMRPQDWIKRFVEEIDQQRAICGIPAPLTKEEFIPCFKDKIDFDALERLNTAMANRKPAAVTWDNVTEAQIKELLIAEFGVKESKVSEVLIQFGPNRLRKPSDMSVATFYHKWHAQLPSCMLPTSDEEHKEFADLVKRALFYFCLDDKLLQEELCKIKEEDQKLSVFLDEAVKAEAHHKAFVEIGATGAQLDNTQGVTVSKYYVNPSKKGQQSHSGQKSGQDYQQSGSKFKKNWENKSTSESAGTTGGAQTPA